MEGLKKQTSGLGLVFYENCALQLDQKLLILSLPGSIMKTRSVVLTFESVDKILWCDHSNETFSAVLLHGTIFFNILQNEI